MIVDGHLDLAWAALATGRDLTRPLDEVRAASPEAAGAMVTLPALGDAGVALVFATIYVEPADSWLPADDVTAGRYATPEEAEALALAQLDVYREWERGGHARIVTGRASLEAHLERFAGDRVPGLLLLMEGADPIVEVADLDAWWARGVRMIGLAWGATRYAGGTGSDAGLTPAGAELLGAMAARGVIHDASHLSEEAFAEAAELPHHALCLTHGAARALMEGDGGRPSRIPLNRFSSDEQLAAVGAAGGVVGLALLDDFLVPGGGTVTVAEHAGAHLARFAAAAGGWERVGIGSDVNPGDERDQTPAELDSVADWHRLAEPVPPDAQAGVLGGNWLRFLRTALPAEG
ncbi:MAG TPA: membrane dipeptidase [Solirubrobacteraceae bacterium]